MYKSRCVEIYFKLNILCKIRLCCPIFKYL
nr:MAG TPA: conotoxin [Bacteriophage sp.]